MTLSLLLGPDSEVLIRNFPGSSVPSRLVMDGGVGDLKVIVSRVMG